MDSYRRAPLPARTVLVVATTALVAVASTATAVVVLTGTQAVVAPPGALAPRPDRAAALPLDGDVLVLPPPAGLLLPGGRTSSDGPRARAARVAGGVVVRGLTPVDPGAGTTAVVLVDTLARELQGGLPDAPSVLVEPLSSGPVARPADQPAAPPVEGRLRLSAGARELSALRLRGGDALAAERRVATQAAEARRGRSVSAKRATPATRATPPKRGTSAKRATPATRAEPGT